MCKGAFPVITIHGEGGIGKTSLALKVAYEILDASDNPFEAIVWTTSKTSVLTATSVRAIEGAISDSLGLIKRANEFLAGPAAPDPFDEVIQYLSQFKILLILDNLETVLDERLRQFLAKTPPGSKILITSRIGVGAYEHPVRLVAMSNVESVQLLRILAKLRNTGRLTAVSNKDLGVYCDRMMNNPGFIKWFVAAVHAGARPEEVLDKPELFLDYCMSNVYDHLSEESKQVLQTLQFLPGGHSLAKIAFIANLDAVAVQVAIQQLLTTNMISFAPVPKGRSFESQYELSALARDYVDRAHPLSVDTFRRLKNRRTDLVRIGEELQAGYKENPYSVRSIAIRSGNDLIVGKYLVDALSAIRSQKLDIAETLVGEARRLAPEFYEVHRVEAWLRVAQRNFTAARNAYEAAIDLEPESAALRLWYGGFLMRYLDETQEALEHLARAQTIDPKSFTINREIACALMYLHQYDPAHAIIEKLLDRADSGERQKITTYDLHLQIHQRRAAYNFKQQERQHAVESLHELQKAFEQIPKRYVDADMRVTLSRARSTALVCSRLIEDPQSLSTLEALVHWFGENASMDQGVLAEDESAETAGHVVRLRTDRGFGFIRLDSGAEAFFHSSQVISPIQFQQIIVGDRVTCEVLQRDRGPTAVNVEIKR